MSRFTQAPFKKPSPLDLPRLHPLSPPDTEVTTDTAVNALPREQGTYMDTSYMKYSKVDAIESYAPPMPVPEPQVAGGKFRRPSNLQYHSSSFMRNDHRPRSATRWLIMAIPPLAVARETGHGSSVMLNSAARSNNGVLLPLFSNMSGQMNAIAREFGFPSTTGICMYLHLADNGLTFTPRISDESWSLLWGHLFEDRQANAQIGGLPIAGRIEFDLDLQKARWFDMWISSCRKEVSGPSPPQSLAFDHRREESRATTDFLQESLVEDGSLHIQRRVPLFRHVPRKLSLLDRIDIAPIKVPSQPVSRTVLSPTDVGQAAMPMPPIMHEREDEETPTVARKVDDKVESWRASSSFAKSPFANTQTALDPANLPNNMPIPDAVVDAEEELPLDLADFTWSISSAGPLSADMVVDSPLEWYRAPSVHLDSRLEGSVCLTPTTCTSFGPPDYDYLGYAPSLISRLPSPDIAGRQIEDSPPTPMTATSWGAPSEWPESPASSFRAPSIDIAGRFLESRPVTPGTATSWGAPLDWPASPATPFYVHTPGIGNMFFDDDHEEQTLLCAGREANEQNEVWKHIWPYVELPDVTTASSGSPWMSGSTLETHLNVGYPTIILYPAVYPNFDIYPAKPLEDGQGRDVDVALKPNYPYFSLYPAVYPAFEIYPEHIVEPQVDDHERLSVKLRCTYPNICVYEPVYPNLVIYPETKTSRVSRISVRRPTRSTRSLSLQEARLLKKTVELSTKLDQFYPFFRLYPPVYPANLDEIYPPITTDCPDKSITTKLESSYPNLNIYPAVYPHLEVYPPVVKTISTGYTAVTSPELTVMAAPHSQRVTREASSSERVLVVCEARYPRFDLYPAVYPFFDIYRSGTGSTPESWREPQSVVLQARYPAINIYPAVYPFFDLYRSGSVSDAELPISKCSVVLSVKQSYPFLDIYPAVYPHFNLYPPAAASDLALVRNRPRKTHAQIVEAVLARNPITITKSTKPTITIKTYQPRKSHAQIVEKVMAGRKRKAPNLRIVVSEPEWEMLSLPPTQPPKPTREVGLPSRPQPQSELRRTVSDRPPVPVRPDLQSHASTGVMRSSSLRQGPPVQGPRDAPVARHSSLRKSIDATATSRREPSRRDSLVLEKARLWGSNVTMAARQLPEIPSSDSSRPMMSELDEFPLPPLPPLPNNSASRTTASRRSVSRLDRSKFPFQ